MINISFDNPYLLWLLIPLVLAVLIPFLIAIRKENKSKETTTALVCHLVIVVLALLAAAGMVNTTVITKTEVYVLADVSHSTGQKLDLIDSYIEELEDQLPSRSEMGIITFGKNSVLHTALGEKITTVKHHAADSSATDIVSAFHHADSLFHENTIKRVVLYTDGLSSDPDATQELIGVVTDMKERGIYIDVVYIDSNLSGNEKEIQISNVECNGSTYLDHESVANVLIESTAKVDAIVRLEKNGEVYAEKTAALISGYNIVNFDLATDVDGEFDYRVSIALLDDVSADFSPHNNTYDFTQTVNATVSVLLVTDKQEDVAAIEALYGDSAEITAFVKPQKPSGNSWSNQQKPLLFEVPYTVEELCRYDQFVLSNVDVGGINNADTFIQSLDICVSQFGKSLITAGDNGLQNMDSTAITALGNMLPVKFGNSEQDPKLYAIVIDASRSMEFRNFDFFRMAKSAAKYLLGFLNENDYFTIVSFWGEMRVDIMPCQATAENIKLAEKAIDDLKVQQGTMIGRTLEHVCDMLVPYGFDEKQVMLISDGMSFEGGETSLTDDPISAALELKKNNIVVSTLNAGNQEGIATMKAIASAGGGRYYFSRSSADLVNVMFDQIADDVTETVMTGNTPVIINREHDKVLQNVDFLPAVQGYVYAKSKASAENILYVNYKKASGTTVQVPLYAYWSYGNGRVATLTTNLSGEWVNDWQDGTGYAFLQNIRTTNVPATRIDYPYTINTHFDGKYTHVEIIPVVVNPDATVSITVYPPGFEQDAEHPESNPEAQLLTFDSYRYFYKFETSQIGKYIIDIDYRWDTAAYPSSSVFNVSYSPEYDSFHVFSPAPIYTFVRNNGTVSENQNVTLTVDPNRLDTYVVSFTVPFLAIAAALYLFDTVIRKLKWVDVKSFFKRYRKGETK